MLDDAPHRRDFMGVKDRAEIAAFPFKDRRQARRHAHVFMAQDHARLNVAARAQRVQRRDGRPRQAHVLLDNPRYFRISSFRSQSSSKDRYLNRLIFCASKRATSISSVSGVLVIARFLVNEFPPAIDDRDVELLLDLAEPARQRRAVQMIQAAIQHLALRPEPMLGDVVARPERTHQNISRDIDRDMCGWSAAHAKPPQFHRFSE